MVRPSRTVQDDERTYPDSMIALRVHADVYRYRSCVARRHAARRSPAVREPPPGPDVAPRSDVIVPTGRLLMHSAVRPACGCSCEELVEQMRKCAPPPPPAALFPKAARWKGGRGGAQPGSAGYGTRPARCRPSRLSRKPVQNVVSGPEDRLPVIDGRLRAARPVDGSGGCKEVSKGDRHTSWPAPGHVAVRGCAPVRPAWTQVACGGSERRDGGRALGFPLLSVTLDGAGPTRPEGSDVPGIGTRHDREKCSPAGAVAGRAPRRNPVRRVH